MVLATQVLLPCVQYQAGEISSGVNTGARVGVGLRTNRVEIEMLEISVSAREDRLVRAASRSDRKRWWRLECDQTSLRLAVGLQRRRIRHFRLAYLLFFLRCRECWLVKHEYRTREDDLQLAVRRIVHNQQRSFVSSFQLLWTI